MFFKTVYSNHNKENIPHKVEVIHEGKSYITLSRKDDKWIVSFDYNNIPSKEFEEYSEAISFHIKATIRMEDMINAQEAKEKAEEEYRIRTTVAERAKLKFNNFVK